MKFTNIYLILLLALLLTLSIKLTHLFAEVSALKLNVEYTQKTQNSVSSVLAQHEKDLQDLKKRIQVEKRLGSSNWKEKRDGTEMGKITNARYDVELGGVHHDQDFSEGE